MSGRLVLVDGFSATGKTSLAKKLAKDLELPLVTKDGIKEILFDTLGWSDLEWSKKLGGATYKIMFYLIEQHMKAGASLIVESTFRSEIARRELQKLRDEFDFAVVEVLCIADGNVLTERFAKRAESGKRHPGHVDEMNTDLYEDLKRGRAEPVALNGALVEVDTTNWGGVDYEAILSRVKEYLPEQ